MIGCGSWSHSAYTDETTNAWTLQSLSYPKLDLGQLLIGRLEQ